MKITLSHDGTDKPNSINLDADPKSMQEMVAVGNFAVGRLTNTPQTIVLNGTLGTKICFVDMDAEYVRNKRYDIIQRVFEILSEKVLGADLPADIDRIAFTVTAVPKVRECERSEQ